METYVAYNNDDDVRFESSSGGVFSALAKHFDVVYGVAMTDDNLNAVFKKTEGDMSELRGAKYLPAQIGKIYIDVKAELDKGKKVLFSGVACQVNGLKAFLKDDYCNLYTVDIICHGIPTIKLWELYTRGKKIDNVNFRYKKEGWNEYGMLLNGEYISNRENKYMQLYLDDCCMRPSCYNCRSKANKKSDLTIGDCWGINRIDESINDNKGISLCIIRSERGKEVFDKSKSVLIWRKITYDEGVKQNKSEYMSLQKKNKREQFFKDIDRMDFESLYKKYVSRKIMYYAIKSKLVEKIKKIVFVFRCI